jgi:hypothetical protein
MRAEKINVWLLPKESKMTVRNLQEVSHSPTCGCKTWLQHWENNSGKNAKTCSALDCSQAAEVGGHVQKRNVNDDSWYIIPICKGCNGKHGQEYEVKADTTFVTVAGTNQCGTQVIGETLYEAGRFLR